MRGPGSALYGSDAFSGVVNNITKTAADTPATEVGARAGSFATRDAWLQHGGTLGPAEMALYLRAASPAPGLQLPFDLPMAGRALCLEARLAL